MQGRQKAGTLYRWLWGTNPEQSDGLLFGAAQSMLRGGSGAEQHYHHHRSHEFWRLGGETMLAARAA